MTWLWKGRKVQIWAPPKETGDPIADKARRDNADWLDAYERGREQGRREALAELEQERQRRWDANADASRMAAALAFAASVIKSGEPWTDECERIIGGALTRGDT